MNERKNKNSRNSSGPYDMLKRLSSLVQTNWTENNGKPRCRIPAVTNYIKNVTESYKESDQIKFADHLARKISTRIKSDDIANPVSKEEHCLIYGSGIKGETFDQLAWKVMQACYSQGIEFDNLDRCVSAIFQYYVLALIEMSDEERKIYEIVDCKPNDDCTQSEEEPEEVEMQTEALILGKELLALAEILGDLRDACKKIGGKLQ